MQKTAMARVERQRHPGTVAFIALISALVAIGLVRGLGIVAAATPTQPLAIPVPPALPTMASAPIIKFARPDFQTGMAYNRFGKDAYGPGDSAWPTGLEDIMHQTGAGWVEIELNFWQPSADSTTITPGPWVTTPADIASGVRLAHALGLHVFIVPHLWYANTQWGGEIYFTSAAQAQAWFAGYWQAIEPFLKAAQQAQADQFALGNEYVGIEQAPAALWNQLIAQAHGVYTGRLTYNMNWGNYVPYAWMSNPHLSALGISMYESLAPGPVPEGEATLAAEWRDRILPLLDQLSQLSGKPIILSEVGYKNTSDALYNPWDTATDAPPDSTLQAAAYQAATQAAFSDPHIAGIYFWGWSQGTYAPNNLPAAGVLHRLFLSAAA